MTNTPSPDEDRELIERVARAIYGADPALRIHPPGNRIVEWEDAPDVVKQRSREQARAAVESLLSDR